MNNVYHKICTVFTHNSYLLSGLVSEGGLATVTDIIHQYGANAFEYWSLGIVEIIRETQH